jgi:hypothetical protein
VGSASNGVDATDRYEVLQGPSVGIIAVPVRCLHDSRSAAEIITSSLAGVGAARGHTCYTSCLTEELLQSSKHTSVWMTSARKAQRVFPCRITTANVTGTCRSIGYVCIPRSFDHNCLYCALC